MLLMLKLFHVVGIMAVLMSLGGLVMHVMNGGTKKSNPHWYRVALTHGFGMATILITGIGLLHANGGGPWPGWAYVKFVVWLWFGLIMAIVHRRPQTAKWVWWILLAAGGLNAALAFYKPI